MSAKKFDMEEFLKSGGKRTEVEHTSNRGRTEVERDYKKFKETDMKSYGVRLHPKDKREFEEYFKKRGMTFSQGVRMIIKDFLERQGM